MNIHTSIKRKFSLKSGISAIAVAAILPFSIQASYAADDDAAADEEVSFEEVIVTGSRIKRDTYSSASPISSFSSEDFKNSGVTGVDEFLKDIPAFTGFQLGASTNNGNDGARKVDMRGLGFNRTLILINGRRQVGDANGDGAVDLNSVPSAMIKNIEVLKDGASTIYGSDALAGVVNIILHDDFEGFEISADYGAATEKWDAENWGISALGGVSNERGNFTMSMQYSKQNEIKQSEREFAQETLFPFLQADGTFLAQGSGSSNHRTMRPQDAVFGSATTTLASQLAAAGGPAGSLITDEVTGEVRAFNGATDTFNFAPDNALITPNERWQFGANGHYDLIDSANFGTVEGYMEVLYTRRTSSQTLAPDASFGTTNDAFGSGLPNDWVPASNPFNPFGDNAAGPDGILGNADDLNPYGITGSGVRVNRRFAETGGRNFAQSSDTFRMVGGLKGDVSDNLSWDFSYTYAENEQIDETKNLHRFDKFAIAVDPAQCALDPACDAAGVIDPFSPIGGITEDQLTFLMAKSLKDLRKSRMTLWSFNLTGDTEGMIELPGGPVGWAIGFENRNEEGQFLPDEFIGEGLTTGGASQPSSGDFGVKEYFGEIFLPLANDTSWAKELSAEASVRHSNYNTSAGKTTTYRVGLNYAPIDDVRFRAVYSTGFRAPNITEINQRQSGSFPIVEPLCEFADRRLEGGTITQTIWDNCNALGFGTDDSTEFGFAWQSLQTTLAPEKPLEPETSKTFTLGTVITPTAIPGLAISVDYWNIEINNVIGTDDINDLFRACMDSVGLTAPACQGFNDSGTGPILTFIFPGDTVTEFGNLGTIKTDGIDINASYQGSIDNETVTGYHATFAATWMNSRTQSFPLSGTSEFVGTADGFGIFPEWRWNTSVGVNGENWDLTWDTRFIGETQDRLRPAFLTDDSVAESVWYHDLIASYTHKGTTLTVGVNNLTDIQAPRFHSAFNANTEPGVFDVIGRRFWAKVTTRF